MEASADQILGAELATRLQCRLVSVEELLDAYDSAKQLIARASRADLVGLLRGKDRNALGPSLRAFRRRGDLPDWVEADVTHLIAATVARTEVKQGRQQKRRGSTTRPWSWNSREANRKQRVDEEDVELEQPAPVSDVELEHPPEDEECECELPPVPDDSMLEWPPGVAQDDDVFLEVPVVEGGRKKQRSSKRPDKVIGQATVWQLEQRGIHSNPEVGKVVANCVEMLNSLVAADRGQRKAIGPELTAVRTRDLLGELLRRVPVSSTDSSNRVAVTSSLAGALCGIPARRAMHHHKTYLRGACEFPTSTSTNAVRTAPSAPVESERTAPSAPLESELEAAQLRVGRAVLAAAVEGRSRASQVREMHRLRIAGCDVGRSLHSERFTEVFEFCMAMVTRKLEDRAMRALVPALGIRSDFGLFADGATIGKIFKSVRSTVLLVGAFFSTPADPRNDTSDILIGAPSEGLDGRALALTQVVRKCIRAAPWHMDDSTIRASLAVVGTDGQYAAGERSKHKPVDAFGPIFTLVGRTPRVHWDHFHRLDHAGNNAIRASAPATEIMQLLHDLESNFGHGQGRLLHRGVTDFLGAAQLSHKHPGGHEAQNVFLSDFPESEDNI